jgi:hypothetical protein
MASVPSFSLSGLVPLLELGFLSLTRGIIFGFIAGPTQRKKNRVTIAAKPVDLSLGCLFEPNESLRLKV